MKKKLIAGFAALVFTLVMAGQVVIATTSSIFVYDYAAVSSPKTGEVSFALFLGLGAVITGSCALILKKKEK